MGTGNDSDKAGRIGAHEDLESGAVLCDAKALPCVMIIFGASGDLAHRKLLPALYNLERDGLLGGQFAVVGFGRTRLDDESFRRETREAIDRCPEAKPFEEAAWGRFAPRLHYVSGEYSDPGAYVRLESTIAACQSCMTCGRRVYYMAVPPEVAEKALAAMSRSGLVGRGARFASRVLMEKPFGLDLAGAQRLNKLLAGMFDESQIYRVDHYLGKDTVRNILVLRFANAIFEPLWNAKYVDNVQVSVAEEIGMEGRGSYYDSAGVVRDMVQNHVLAVLGLVAMEAPLAGDAESVRDRKLDVFKSLTPILPEEIVFGQYEGYRQEPDVRPNSCTPTFVAFKIIVNNWRWYGVPFYVKAGKRMAKKLTEVAIQFKAIPLCVIDDPQVCRRVNPNVLHIHIQPDEGISLGFSVKAPGRQDDVTGASMDFFYSRFGVRIPSAYERILLDSFCGAPALFWRNDEVEAAWKAVEPLLAGPCEMDAGAFPNYRPGSWGPGSADELLRRDGRYWQEPR